MIFYELAILGGVFILAIVAIAAFGRPMAEAYAAKMKIESQPMTEGQAKNFEKRIKELEEEVETLNSQVLGMQESLEFTLKLVDKSDSSANLEAKIKKQAP